MEELKEQLQSFSKDELIGILANYANQKGDITDEKPPKGCPGHEGQCGVCLNGLFVPCG